MTESLNLVRRIAAQRDVLWAGMIELQALLGRPDHPISNDEVDRIVSSAMERARDSAAR